MLTYFSKNRHGVISVFMAIILIVIISFSSLMVELGRKRNLDAYFQQVIETSTFSTLSNYDRKLYKKFSLMALSSDVDETTLQKYINANLNSGIDSEKTLDREMLLEKIEVQGIYDLANPDVLRQQIEENWKYRGPYNIIDGTLNLENSLTDYIKSLEKAVPALQFFKNISTTFVKITEVIEKVVALDEATTKMENARSAYEDGVTVYNAAVTQYESNINSLDANDENYSEKKASYDQEINNAAVTFKNEIQAYISGCDGFVNAVDAFATKYAEFISSGSDIVLQGIIKEEYDKVMQNNAGPYKDWTNEEKKDYADALDKMEKATKSDEIANLVQSVKDMLENVKKDKFKDLTKDLVEQKDSIKGDDWPQASVIKLHIGFIAGITLLIDYVEFIIDICAKFIKLAKTLWETLKTVIDVFNCLSYAITLAGPDLKYNDSISAVIQDLPSKNSSVTNTTTIDSDEGYITEQLDKTKEISKELNYNTDYINPTVDNSSLALADKLENLSQKGQTIINIGQDIVQQLSEFKILSFIKSIVKMLIAIVEFAGAMLEVMDAFIAQFFGVSSIMEIIYRKLMIADYAAMMFPNRTSKYVNATDGLGNKWKDRASGWSLSNDFSIATMDDSNFSLARAEYIFVGNASEITNQTIVFGVMYGLRSLSNIFPTVTNKTVLDVAAMAPPFSIIAAIIIGFVFLILETYVDMILLCCGRVKLPLVKTVLWCFTAEGAKKLAEKLKKMSKLVGDQLANALTSDVADNPEGNNEKNGKTYLQEANEKFIDGLEIGYWGYTDYLRLMFTFSSEQKILLRVADLIQLEMTKATGKEYKMKEKYTYLRVKAKAKYKAIMPIPFVTNANSELLSINKIYYMGY